MYDESFFLIFLVYEQENIILDWLIEEIVQKIPGVECFVFSHYKQW